MDANSTKDQVSLKLVVNKETNKVIFAEAGKDFVDVLISFLTLPLGTIVRLVGKESDMQPAVKVGSLSSLYESVANLNKEFMLTNSCREMLLQPRNSMEDYCRSLKLNIDDTEPTQYYICTNLWECSRNCGSVLSSTFKNKKCSCGNFLSKLILPQSSTVAEGFVKDDVSFIITDDLILNAVPNAFTTTFCLLKNYSVEEMTVNVAKKQVMDLFKCSLLSKITLTDFFLEKKLLLEKNEQTRLSLGDIAVSSNYNITVDVLYRKSDGKVMFALGKADFADFISSFLTFPLGGVVRLLNNSSSVGNIDGLYKSIVDLNEDFFKAKEVKGKLVDIKLAPQFKLGNQILPICQSDTPSYYCYYNSSNPRYDLHVYYLTTTYIGLNNPAKEISKPLTIVDPISTSESAKGFVKGPTMFMATDDLVVKPLSFSSVISVLNSTNTSINDLEGKVVKIGIKEGLSILKTSLISNSALTNGLGHLLTNVAEDK
ncbi:hypothetical protein RIF29_30398 [Crotalaria pallida]|uniref:DUF674 family protein n=1 Tax=Crotalaria pallida TaxID=3830 RepID=A0AAN9EGK6_CROPI